jgi:hypothetical protein
MVGRRALLALILRVDHTAGMDQEREDYADPDPPPTVQNDRWPRVAGVVIFIGLAILTAILFRDDLFMWLIMR